MSVEKIVKRNEAGSELSRKSGLGAEHGAGAERLNIRITKTS